jgi:hypothetical protein
METFYSGLVKKEITKTGLYTKKTDLLTSSDEELEDENNDDQQGSLKTIKI